MKPRILKQLFKYFILVGLVVILGLAHMTLFFKKPDPMPNLETGLAYRKINESDLLVLAGTQDNYIEDNKGSSYYLKVKDNGQDKLVKLMTSNFNPINSFTPNEEKLSEDKPDTPYNRRIYNDNKVELQIVLQSVIEKEIEVINNKYEDFEVELVKLKDSQVKQPNLFIWKHSIVIGAILVLGIAVLSGITFIVMVRDGETAMERLDKNEHTANRKMEE